MALDKKGNLVIIENKLDDSGRDVTWQALKYASYCSSLSKEDIRHIYQDYLNKQGQEKLVEELLIDFFNGMDYEDLLLNRGFGQRIIFVAAKFRKEVTSTVLWLMNYNIKLQCFKVTPYKLDEQLFLNIQQIIPVKDTEDYIIKMAEKAQENLSDEVRQNSNDILRQEFWTELLKAMNAKSDLFKNINPIKNGWISSGSGVFGVPYTFVIAKSYSRIELYIDRGVQEENKFVYDYLVDRKDEIEAKFGGNLVWERLDDKRASRIKYQLDKNAFIKEDWEEIIQFLVDAMIRFEKAIK